MASGRCDTTLDGNQCLFSGEHGDHIAKGSDDRMWIDRNKAGTWTPLDGGPNTADSASSGDVPSLPVPERTRPIR